MNTTITTHLQALCVTVFGHENPTTIEVFKLLEEGLECLALETFSTAYLNLINSTEESFDEEYEEYSDDVDECGFDSYMGCYTGDC